MIRAAFAIAVLCGGGVIVLRAAGPPVNTKGPTKTDRSDATARPAVKPNAASTQKPEAASAQKPADSSAKKKDELPREVFTGQVVLLREALKRRGIPSQEEFDKQVVLETPAGELIPIVPDWRGRAFYQDEQLRNRNVELVGMRRPGVPYLQVLMIFTFDDKGARQYTDYWCDICSFPMYEIKPCDCCQAPIHLRFQPRDLPDYVKQKP